MRAASAVRCGIDYNRGLMNQHRRSFNLRDWLMTYWGGVMIAVLLGLAFALLIRFVPENEPKYWVVGLAVTVAVAFAVAWYFHPERWFRQMSILCLTAGTGGGFSLVVIMLRSPSGLQPQGNLKVDYGVSPIAMGFGIVGACFFGWLEYKNRRVVAATRSHTAAQENDAGAAFEISDSRRAEPVMATIGPNPSASETPRTPVDDSSMDKGSGDGSNTQDSDMGVFVPGNKAGHQTGILLVYLHGLNSNSKSLRKLGGYLTSGFTARPDAFYFEYPSKWYHKADYRTAVEHLRNTLTTGKYRSYRHLCFIGHSTGGLIVKSLLTSKREDIKNAIEKGNIDPYSGEWIVFRTRRIINIGVPHRGSQVAGYPQYFVFLLVGWWLVVLLGVGSYVAAIFGKGSKRPFGFNRIPWDLTFGSSGLGTLANDVRTWMSELCGEGLPRPSVIDFVGDNDRVARAHDMQDKPAVDPDAPRIINVPGSHSSMKLPTKPDDAIVTNSKSFINEVLKDSAGSSDVGMFATAMDRTICLTRRVDNHFSISRLTETSNAEPPLGYGERTIDSEYDERVLDGSWVGAQLQVFSELRKQISKPSNGIERFLVIGAAGVGKSAVLRRLGSALAVDATRGACDTPVPVVIPLHRYRAPSPKPGSESQNILSWENLGLWWCQWSDDEARKAVETSQAVASNGSITSLSYDWLNRQVLSRSCVLIIDGIDDFLVRHPWLTIDGVLSMLDEMQKSYTGPGLRIVLGLRSSHALPGITKSHNVFQISRLTKKQADIFHMCLRPKVDNGESRTAEIFKGRSDSVVRLLRTPLILAKMLRIYANSKGQRIDGLNTEADIYRAVLTEDFSVPSHGARARSGQGPTPEQRLDALTLVGHVVFMNGWPAFSIKMMLEQTQSLLQAWEIHAASIKATSDPSSPLIALDQLGQLRAVLDGFRFATTEESLRDLLTTPIFLNVHQTRFEHREWETYLAARHLMLAVRFGHALEMSRKGSSTRMYFLIADMFDSETICKDSSSILEPVADIVGEYASHLARTLPQDRKFLAQIPVGNYLGVFGHAKVVVQPEFFEKIARRYLGQPSGVVPPLVELVALQTLGYRALSMCADSLDQGRTLDRVLESSYCAPQALSSNNPLLVLSAAWWRKAIRSRLHDTRSVFIPELNALTFANAVGYVATLKDGKYAPSPLDRRMQEIMLSVQNEMRGTPDKTPACVTYLVVITAAVTARKAEAYVAGRLGLIFGQSADDQTNHELLIKQFRDVPELDAARGACEKWFRENPI
jgi:hypothetical protein